MADTTEVVELKSMKDYRSALEAGGVAVVDCFATWCGPCKVIAPKIAEFAREFPAARFYKVDVDEVPDVAQELGIRAMPTFKFFKDGELVDDVVGANPPAIKAAVEKALA